MTNFSNLSSLLTPDYFLNLKDNLFHPLRISYNEIKWTSKSDQLEIITSIGFRSFEWAQALTWEVVNQQPLKLLQKLESILISPECIFKRNIVDIFLITFKHLTNLASKHVDGDEANIRRLISSAFSSQCPEIIKECENFLNKRYKSLIFKLVNNTVHVECNYCLYYLKLFNKESDLIEPTYKVRYTFDFTLKNVVPDYERLLSFIKERPQEIVSIYLRNSKFNKEIFHELARCKNLKKLGMIDLSEIIDFSPLYVLKKLEYLEITSAKFPELDLSHFPKLEVLDISCWNELKTINLSSLQSLKKISIKYRMPNLIITTLPRCSDVSINSFHWSAPNINFLEKLKDTLVNLDLSHNNLISAPPVLASLTSLKSLNLSSCKLGNTCFHTGRDILNCFLSQSLQIPAPDFLSSLHGLTKLEDLNLNYNSLQSLPPELGNLKDLTSLKLQNNHLTSIPGELGNLTKLTNLSLSRNPLRSLPLSLADLGPNLLTLNLQETLIGRLPEELAHLSRRTQFGEESYSFVLEEDDGKTLDIKEYNRKDIKLKTKELIARLAEGLTMNHSKLFVKYVEEKGIDAGGPSKDLITHLFKQIKRKYLREGMPSWNKAEIEFLNDIGSLKYLKEGIPSAIAESLDVNRKALFNQIGVILAFLLRIGGRFAIGNTFSAEFFERLRNFPLHLLKSSLQDLSMTLSSHLSKADKEKLNYDSLQKFCEAKDIESASMHKEAVANLFMANGFDPSQIENKFLQGIVTETIDGEEYYIIFDEQILLELQKTVKKELLAYCEDSLYPLLEIAKGFYQFKPMLEARNQLSADLMYNIIQGNSSSKAILASLEYINGAECHKKLLEDWIEDAPPEKLENFICYVTGSRAVKVGQVVKITIKPGIGMMAHACSDALDLPSELDPVEFYKYLNEIKSNEGFKAI